MGSGRREDAGCLATSCGSGWALEIFGVLRHGWSPSLELPVASGMHFLGVQGAGRRAYTPERAEGGRIGTVTRLRSRPVAKALLIRDNVLEVLTTDQGPERRPG